MRYRKMLCAVVLTLICPSHIRSSGPDVSVPDILDKMTQANARRSAALMGYMSTRYYHVEYHGLKHMVADMEVETTFCSPNQKTFRIVSESGSGTLRSHVFKKLLEAEQEAATPEMMARTALDNRNYEFKPGGEDDANGAIVLVVVPKRKDKFLFKGKVWIDAEDYAVTRVEGEPAVNPSFWTKRTDFIRTYNKVSGFYLPSSNSSKTQVRIAGHANLEINYGAYRIIAGGASEEVCSAEAKNRGAK